MTSVAHPTKPLCFTDYSLNASAQIGEEGAGLPEIGTPIINNQEDYRYWYAGVKYSNAWSRAEYFRQHWGWSWVNTKMRGYKYVEYINAQACLNYFDEIRSMAEPGDVIVAIDSNGQAWHAMIVREVEASDIILAQHTPEIKSKSAKGMFKNYTDRLQNRFALIKIAS